MVRLLSGQRRRCRLNDCPVRRAASHVERLHPLSGKFRATADYAEAKRNFGGGWGTSRLGENGSAIPGSATASTSGMSEAGAARCAGADVAVQVPSHGIPIVAQGPNAII